VHDPRTELFKVKFKEIDSFLIGARTFVFTKALKSRK
jgi:hypothetical protein